MRLRVTVGLLCLALGERITILKIDKPRGRKTEQRLEIV